MVDGLGDALARFNKSSGPGTVDDKTLGNDTGKGSKSETGHTFHVHRHTNGSHHLTVHGKHGQMVHHSEHDSLEAAAQEMTKHGGGGAGKEAGDSGTPSEETVED
jgi:hypothetical protein